MQFSCFRFTHHFLRHSGIREGQGRSAIIGDNLASHINLSVLQTCKKYNIAFICLPPNSTHICWPLDVAIYGPLKHYWRDTLRQWKESPEGKTSDTLSKERFPTLLSRVVAKLRQGIALSLKNGFRKCGIYPTDKEELLKWCV